MDITPLVSTSIKVAVALFAFEAALWLLRRLDRRASINFAEQVWQILSEDPLAVAIYFGARFVGVALMVGLVVA